MSCMGIEVTGIGRRKEDKCYPVNGRKGLVMPLEVNPGEISEPGRRCKSDRRFD